MEGIQTMINKLKYYPQQGKFYLDERTKYHYEEQKQGRKLSGEDSLSENSFNQEDIKIDQCRTAIEPIVSSDEVIAKWDPNKDYEKNEKETNHLSIL